MATLKSLEKEMWDNYYAQEKLIKQRSKLRYDDPKSHTLSDKINNLIGERKALDKQWNALKKVEYNKEKSKYGIKVGDRVRTVTISPFLGSGDVIEGTVVMYRNVIKIKLDNPQEFNKKYAPLTKSWRKIA